VTHEHALQPTRDEVQHLIRTGEIPSHLAPNLRFRIAQLLHSIHEDPSSDLDDEDRIFDLIRPSLALPNRCVGFVEDVDDVDDIPAEDRARRTVSGPTIGPVEDRRRHLAAWADMLDMILVPWQHAGSVEDAWQWLAVVSPDMAHVIAEGPQWSQRAETDRRPWKPVARDSGGAENGQRVAASHHLRCADSTAALMSSEPQPVAERTGHALVWRIRVPFSHAGSVEDAARWIASEHSEVLSDLLTVLPKYNTLTPPGKHDIQHHSDYLSTGSHSMAVRTRTVRVEHSDAWHGPAIVEDVEDVEVRIGSTSDGALLKRALDAAQRHAVEVRTAHLDVTIAQRAHDARKNDPVVKEKRATAAAQKRAGAAWANVENNGSCLTIRTATSDRYALARCATVSHWLAGLLH
jgi:hypothetical protein